MAGENPKAEEKFAKEDLIRSAANYNTTPEIMRAALDSARGTLSAKEGMDQVQKFLQTVVNPLGEEKKGGTK